ncbi:hypothetical protein DPMN_137010 [Dreissena polymorpha]|uniref:Uncharacterized protein n=1 Tax=Dreissena polymorpha TaxID=45954 RepID=A0A9D4JHA0_DREPO|nr:hypothetical protein DPMN_137010 [Dreissena polymorpha]
MKDRVKPSMFRDRLRLHSEAKIDIKLCSSHIHEHVNESASNAHQYMAHEQFLTTSAMEEYYRRRAQR